VPQRSSGINQERGRILKALTKSWHLQVMKGYLDNDEATRATLTSSGWLHSGDIVYYDEKERFYVVDRLKELIKVKGYQVPPAELEDVIRSHPQVQDVAVIGVPHDRYGEVPRAYIVKKDPNVDKETLYSYVASEVTEYKRLRGGIQFVDQIPKSAAGKILRRQLKEMFLQGH
jgi:4-coumarate--CoA ligase